MAAPVAFKRFSFCGCCSSAEPGPPGTGDLESLAWHESASYSVDAEIETWVAEVAFDFDLLDASIGLLECQLTGLSKQLDSATATYRVRLDGTPGGIDGTVLAALTTTNAAYVIPPDTVTGPAFARPAGTHLLKVTIEPLHDIEDPPSRSYLKSFEVVILGA